MSTTDSPNIEGGNGSVRLSRDGFLRSGIAGAAAVAVGMRATDASARAPLSTASHGAVSPKRGGNLRVAMVGGTPADSLDADDEINFPQVMRNFALYNGLVALSASGSTIALDLAEEIHSSKDAKTWTIRVKPGITFHNGKPLTAQDVVYTFTRIANPKTPHSGASSLALVDFKNIKVLDKRTVRIPMKAPYSTFLEQISLNYYFGIVPVGYNPKSPVGTGPFKVKSFVPGQQSVFVRNNHYHKTGLPYLDSLTIIDSFSDATAAFNALSSGQVDVSENAPPVLVNQAKANSKLKALISKPGLWIPFVMRADVPPFNNAKVRQAFRLIVDRPQMINVSVSGLGVVANDVFGQHDPCYNASLHRQQDIARARALLKSAGQANMKIELVTSDFTAGAVESAQVFAQQAKAAGVNVQLRKLPYTNFFAGYTKWRFTQDFIAYEPFMTTFAQTSLPGGFLNTTHFNPPRLIKLYNQANAITDAKKRCAVLREMQQILFEEGGYIIPSFNRQVDLMAKNVNGFGEAGTGIPLGNGNWEHAWLA